MLQPWLTVLSVVALVRAPVVEVGPPPPWVDLPPPALSSSAEENRPELLFIDQQVRLGAPPFERFYRLVRRVSSPDSIEHGSEFRFEFDPSYQELVVHGIWIHRGGRRIPSFRKKDVTLLQREEQLDARTYDGRITALVYLRDVRPGDVIESAWTVRGSNPVFGERHSGSFSLARRSRVERLRFRMVHPPGHFVATRVNGLELASEVSSGPWGSVLTWERRDVPEASYEDGVPDDVEAEPWVEWSEWRDWREVAEWGTRLFPVRFAPALAPHLATFRAEPDVAARVTSALRFVEQEVRYLGIELGVASHRPSDPAEVLSRRYGDCKDKSQLLVAFLRALDVEAEIALTSTSDGSSVSRRLPSPGVFDHAIVRARVDGTERWLDPTRSYERARLADIQPPDTRTALVLRPGAAELSAVPRPAAFEQVQEDELRIDRWGEPATLRVVTHYKGLEAARMRRKVAVAKPRLQETALRFYARDEPQIRVTEALAVEDAPDRDELVVTETYELPATRHGDRRSLTAASILDQLDIPTATTSRRFPLEIVHPVRVREVLTIRVPGRLDLSARTRDERGPASRLRREVTSQDSVTRIEWTYESLSDRVEAKDVARHVASVRAMRDLSSIRVPLFVQPSRRQEQRSGNAAAWVAGSVVAVGVALLIGGPRFLDWFSRRRARRFASKTRFRIRAGESASLPATMDTLDEALAAATRERCTCGGSFPLDSARTEAVRYGGEDLALTVATCERCGTRRSLYWVTAQTPPATSPVGGGAS